ncbi:glutamate/aspartate transport system substrate-binding protein [Variovorax boronicumulans]|nr:glutamate/aspartate transport system substrate-binding protein [Variovorax boronicumulans]
MDICHRIYEQVKAELKRPDLKLRYNLVDGKNRIADVRNGVVDVECGATTITAERQKDIAFSYAFFVSGARFMVKKQSGIQNELDLRDKRIAVAEGTTTEKVLRSVSANMFLNAKVVPTKDAASAFAALEKDEADAAITEDAGLWGLASKSKSPQDFKLIGKFLTQEPYGIGFRKDDARLAELIDKTLLGLFASGEAEKIFAYWFQTGPHVGEPFEKSRLLSDAFRRPSKFSPL